VHETSAYRNREIVERAAAVRVGWGQERQSFSVKRYRLVDVSSDALLPEAQP
jgi:hypothetical protein